MLTIWIICAISCIILFLPIKKPDIKLFNFELIFGAVFFFFLVVLMTANSTGYDARSFKIFYNYVKQNGINPYDYTYNALFVVLSFFLKFFKQFNYQQFHAIVLLVTGVVCIYPFLKKYAVNLVAVMLLYVLSGTFASDGMQFKNFIATSFLIAAMYFYFDSEYTKLKLFIFYLLLAVSVCFHFSFVLYAVLPITKTKCFRKFHKLFPLIGGALYVIVLSGGSVVGLIISLLSRISFLDKLGYYAASRAGLRSLVPVAIYYLILLVLNSLSKPIGDDMLGDLSEKDRNVYLLQKNMILIWQLMGVVLPVLGFANASYRLFRNLYIPIFTVMTNSIVTTKGNKRLISSILSLCVATLIFLYPILIKQQMDIYIPVLEGDWFWSNS